MKEKSKMDYQMVKEQTPSLKEKSMWGVGKLGIEMVKEL